MTRRGRGGRPKKEGAHYPSGHLIPAFDRGTPELQAKRQEIVGPRPQRPSKKNPRKGDATLSTTPYGKLLALGLIGQEAYDKAQYYEICRSKTVGSSHAAALDPSKVGGGAGELSDKAAADIAKAKASYLEMSRALDDAGVKTPFEEVVVEHLWSRVTGSAIKIKRRERRLLHAFTVLVKLNRTEKRKAA